MSYKQASKSDLQRVVGGMVDKGLAETSDRIKALADEMARTNKAAGVAEVDIAGLVQGLKSTREAKAQADKAIDERFKAFGERQVQALEGLKELSNRMDTYHNELKDLARQLGATKQSLGSATARMTEIEHMLIRSREEAINKLALTLSRSILTAMNEAAGK